MPPPLRRLAALVLAVVAFATAARAQPEPRQARPGDLAFSVTLDTLHADTLRAAGRIVNVSDQTVRVQYGMCSLHLIGRRAAPDGSVADTAAVWDALWAGSPEGDGVVCLSYLAQTTLAPGDTLEDGGRGELSVVVPALWVLQDATPGGVFHVEARFDLTYLDGGRYAPYALVADAGLVRVDPRRPPVGESIERHGAALRVAAWDAAPGPSGDARVSALVKVLTLPYRRNRIVGFDSCAVRVAAFASEADLAEAPRRVPVASVAAACGEGRPVSRQTSSGEAFYTASDSTVTVTVDMALAALGLPPGTWWLGIELRPVRGFDALAPLNPVWLALGPVVVR